MSLPSFAVRTIGWVVFAAFLKKKLTTLLSDSTLESNKLKSAEYVQGQLSKQEQAIKDIYYNLYVRINEGLSLVRRVVLVEDVYLTLKFLAYAYFARFLTTYIGESLSLLILVNTLIFWQELKSFCCSTGGACGCCGALLKNLQQLEAKIPRYQNKSL